MTLIIRIAFTTLLATSANGVLADAASSKPVTDPIKQCQAGCSPKRPDATQFEQCMLDCRKPEVAQKFLEEKLRQQEQASKK